MVETFGQGKASGQVKDSGRGGGVVLKLGALCKSHHPSCSDVQERERERELPRCSVCNMAQTRYEIK